MDNKLFLKNAPKGVETPTDGNIPAWQRRYSWVVQSALADPDQRMSPADAGKFAREVVGDEFARVNPEGQVPDFLAE